MRHVCDRNSVGSKASRRDVASLSTTNYAGQNNLGESLRVLTESLLCFRERSSNGVLGCLAANVLHNSNERRIYLNHPV